MDIILNVPTRRQSSKSNVNCCVHGCSSVSKKNPQLSFHKFPSVDDKVCDIDEFGNQNLVNRRKLWENKLKMGKAASAYMRVCSQHFTDDDYITPNDDCYAKRILKRTAVPNRNLPSTFLMCQHVGFHRRRLKTDAFPCELAVLENFQCEFCGFSTNLKVDLTEHFRVFHQEKEENEQMENILKWYHCGRCYFETHSLLMLVKHLDDCNARFKNNSMQEEHTNYKNKSVVFEHSYAKKDKLAQM